LQVWKQERINEMQVKRACSRTWRTLHHSLAQKIQRAKTLSQAQHVVMLAHPGIRHQIDSMLAEVRGLEGDHGKLEAGLQGWKALAALGKSPQWSV
jgi:hypothetical protein